MALYPNEEYLLRKEASFQNNTGTLGLTNIRLIFIAADSTVPMIMFEYSKIANVESEEYAVEKISILKVSGIDTSQRQRTVYFGFTTATHKEDAETCITYIRSNRTQQIRLNALHILTKESQKKIEMLSKHSALKLLHSKLVIDDRMSEEEFWRLCPQYQKHLVQKHEQDQVPGKLSRLIRIPHKIMSRNHIKVDLHPEHIGLVFRQFPEVKRDFHNSVPHRKSEADFWKQFWETQLEQGKVLTDALEIQIYQEPEISSRTPDETLPDNFGIYKSASSSNSTAIDILEHLNRHSSQVLQNFSAPGPALAPPVTEFNVTASAIPCHSSDAPAPYFEDWKQSLCMIHKSSDVRQVFPSNAESAETLRLILQQTFISPSSNEEEDSATVLHAERIHEMLRYFYRQFPLMAGMNLALLKAIVELCKTELDQMREVCRQKVSIEYMRTAVELAHERLARLEC